MAHTKNRSLAGMTLPELLVSLAITAMLLTALAVAVNATMTSYTTNQDMATATVSSRNALRQMCRTIRSAWNEPDNPIGVNDDGTTCSLVDAGGRNIIYRYDADAQQLQININGSDDWYGLVDGVLPVVDGDAIFVATAPPAGGWPGGTVGRVVIRFRVVAGDISRSVSAAAVPRNVLYDS